MNKQRNEAASEAMTNKKRKRQQISRGSVGKATEEATTNKQQEAIMKQRRKRRSMKQQRKRSKDEATRFRALVVQWSLF